MKKAEKEIFVKDLREKLEKATSAVLVDYTGLSVKMQQDLKKRLKEVGASMLIVKNTLFKLSGKGAEYPEDILSDTVLTGPTALIVTDGDPIAPIQIIAKFAKEFELPQFKVGVVDKAFQDKSALTRLSLLPSKEVLYAQVVGSISAPMYGIVGTLQGNLQKLIYLLTEASNKAAVG